MSDAAEAPHNADARSPAERRDAMLAELAALGMEASRIVVAKAHETPSADTALALSRLARAVRLTVMLQARLAAEAGRGQNPAADVEQRKARVQRIVERVAKADPDKDDDDVEAVVYETADRLDDEDLYGDLMDRPIREIVARICDDLDLKPDWTVLDQELWAREEAAADPPPLEPAPPPKRQDPPPPFPNTA